MDPGIRLSLFQNEDNENEFTLELESDNRIEGDDERLLKVRCYVPMCLVLISQKPYFMVMKDCLSR